MGALAKRRLDSIAKRLGVPSEVVEYGDYDPMTGEQEVTVIDPGVRAIIGNVEAELVGGDSGIEVTDLVATIPIDDVSARPSTSRFLRLTDDGDSYRIIQSGTHYAGKVKIGYNLIIRGGG